MAHGPHQLRPVEEFPGRQEGFQGIDFVRKHLEHWYRQLVGRGRWYRQLVVQRKLGGQRGIGR